jgi:ABC-2 type transport system permease protein
MTAVLDNLRAAAAVVRRDWLITISYRTRFITHLLSVFFSLTLFHFISRLVHVSSFSTPDAYFAFVMVGLISLQVLNSTLHVPPGALRQELVAGTFERFLLSPVGGLVGIVSMMLFPFLYALVSAVVMLILAGLVFGIHLQWATVPLVVPVGLLGALSFAPFGVLFLSIVLMAKQAISGATFLVAFISIVSGLYFPVALLPGWMRWMSDVQPFTPAVDLMRHVMVGSHLREAVWAELAKMAGFTAVLLPLSIWVLAVALRLSRRWGTILEY